MRNYKHIDGYLTNLQNDIQFQPEDAGHTDWTKHAIDEYMPGITGISSLLDVGCGTGFSKPFFDAYKVGKWVGVTVNQKEIEQGISQGRDIREMDFSFLTFPDGTFDMIFARHVLEHSPMPLLTLMEWRRVCTRHLLCILPCPDYWGEGGINHYYVLPRTHWWYLFDRAGWKVDKETLFTTSSPLFMKHFLPEQKDRTKVTWPGRPKTLEYRFLLSRV